MKNSLFVFCLLLISPISHAALIQFVGDAVFGTVGSSGCDTNGCYVNATPGSSIDPDVPINGAFPNQFEIYLTNPQFDSNTGLFFQPEFGVSEIYLSTTDSWFNVTKKWRGIAGVAEQFINKTFSLTEKVFLSAGETFGVYAGGIALGSNAFVDYRITASAVPLPASMLLLLPSLLILLGLRQKNKPDNIFEN